jgi:hypothetical protein
MRLSVLFWTSIQLHTQSHTSHLHLNLRSLSLFQLFQKRKLSLPSTLFLEDQLEDPMGFGHSISLT